jgi:hypothetical protein
LGEGEAIALLRVYTYQILVQKANGNADTTTYGEDDPASHGNAEAYCCANDHPNDHAHTRNSCSFLAQKGGKGGMVQRGK